MTDTNQKAREKRFDCRNVGAEKSPVFIIVEFFRYIVQGVRMTKNECNSHTPAIFLFILFNCQFLSLSAQSEVSDSVIRQRIQVIGDMLERGSHGANS